MNSDEMITFIEQVLKVELVPWQRNLIRNTFPVTVERAHSDTSRRIA